MRASNNANGTSLSVDKIVTYNGVPIQKYGHDLVHIQDFHTFNANLSASCVAILPALVCEKALGNLKRHLGPKSSRKARGSHTLAQPLNTH